MQPNQMDEAAIEAERERNRRAIKSGENVSPQVAQQKEYRRQRVEQLARATAFRREVAKAMGVSVDGLLSALDAARRKSPAKAPAVDAVWAAARRIGESANDEDLDIAAVYEALVALELVKAGAIKGIDTELPPAQRRKVSISDSKWVEPVARVAGLDADRFAYPGVATIEAKRQEAYEKIWADRRAQLFDPKSYTRNDSMATRAAELLEQRVAKQRDAEFAAWHDRGCELRAAVVQVLDDVLKATPIDIKWWWTRQLRRLVAGERAQVTDLDVVWRMLAALNARVPFERVAELVK